MDGERARGPLSEGELQRYVFAVEDEHDERIERIERAVLKLASLTGHENEIRAVLDEGA